MIDLFYTIGIVSFVLISLLVSNHNKVNNIIFLYFLYFYHLVFAYMYYKMTLSSGGDAIGYYFGVKNELNDYVFNVTNMGTSFIKNITYLMIKYLHLSYLNTTLLFSTISFFGFYLLYCLVNYRFTKNDYLFILFLIPGTHFWTVSVGKDSLIFFCIALLVYSIIHEKKFFLSLSILGIFMIRPHVAAMFAIAYFIVIIFYSRIKLSKKIIFSAFIIFIYFILFKTILEYIGLQDISLILEYISKRQELNLDGGSSVNIREYTLLAKIFTYLYRPFFESTNIFYLVVSFENLLYLILSIYLIKNIKYIFKEYKMVFFILASIIFIVFMSLMTANLGIAIRQKIMIYPFLLISIFYIYNLKNKEIK